MIVWVIPSIEKSRTQILHDIRNTHITISPIVSEIICLTTIHVDGGPTDRETEIGDLFFRTLEVMTRRENMKVISRPINSITILP